MSSCLAAQANTHGINALRLKKANFSRRREERDELVGGVFVDALFHQVNGLDSSQRACRSNNLVAFFAPSREIVLAFCSRVTLTSPTSPLCRILAGMTDEQLAQRISDVALLRGDFTLRSGRKSKYYLDKYLFETQPDILAEVGKRLANHVTPDTDRIAGPELGGVALATATALSTGKPMILIRNAKKDYGTAKRFEGKLEPGDRVLITEDIATSGGQSIEAAKLLRDEMGCVVTKIVVVIDRQEGARQAIEAEGFEFASLLTKADLGIDE